MLSKPHGNAHVPNLSSRIRRPLWGILPGLLCIDTYEAAAPENIQWVFHDLSELYFALPALYRFNTASHFNDDAFHAWYMQKYRY